MSLVILKEPKVQKISSANTLDIGTWFVDMDNQIYMLVLDDRTNEKRILCAGNHYKPFLPNISAKDISVERILKEGTLLQITYSKGEVANV